MEIYTIGFAQKTASRFFDLVRASEVKNLLDVRLNNTSQLAGFTKRDDLRYFLKHILNMGYLEMPDFAPSSIILKEYRKTKDWESYEYSYQDLLQKRNPGGNISKQLLDDGIILLCSEPKADHCHRRLAAEYIAKSIYPNAKITHL